MSRQSEESIVRAWNKRFLAGKALHREWEEDFDCELLEDYIAGFQWEDRLSRANDNSDPKDHYTINLCFASLNTRLPSLFFYRPKPRITPKPARGDDVGSNLVACAQLMEDTAYSFMGAKDVGFKRAVELCTLDAQTRFGVVEVGYSADFVDNPHAGKPMLDDEGKEMLKDDKPVLQPAKIIKDGVERVYIKRIPAKNFVVPVNCGNNPEEADWVAYSEWVYLEDLKKNKSLDNTGMLKDYSGRINKKYDPDASTDPEKYSKRNGMVKLVHMFDQRAKEKLLFVEGRDFFLKRKKLKFTPLAYLRFHERLDDFFPIPPVYQWISPQDEYNETRDSQRIHRQRFARRYIAIEGRISTDEAKKLEHGGDGTIAWAQAPDAVVPVQDAALDRATITNVQMARNDFNEVSGTPSEQRGIAQAETATQASLVDQNAKIRDTSDREKVGAFVSDIVRLLLLTLREDMQLKFWIQVNTDPNGPLAAIEADRITQLYKELSYKDLGSFDFDVEVDVESMTPVNDDLKRNQWTQVLGLLGNPQVMIACAASQALLKRTLSLYGIRSAEEVKEIQDALRAVLIITVPQAAQALWGPGITAAGAMGEAGAAPAMMGGPGGGGMPQPGPTPGLPGIMTQLMAQLGGRGPAPGGPPNGSGAGGGPSAPPS
jgi:hypothetical protein